MASSGTPDKYIHFLNAREHRSKLQRVCEKEKIPLEYMTPHTPNLNVIIEKKLKLLKKER